MGTEVLVQKTQAEAQVVPFTADLNDVLPEDIQIGSLSLIQGSSHPLLKAGAAKPGDIFNSAINKVVGGLIPGGGTQLVDIIVLASQPVWHWFFVDSPKKEFCSWEVRTKSQDSFRKKDFVADKLDKDGKVRKAKPYPGVKVVCLQVNDIKGLPLKLDIKKTSYWGAGKAIETLRFLAQQAKKPLYSKVISLGVKEQSYEGNDWFSFTAAPGREATQEEMDIAQIWENTFKLRPSAINDSEGTNEC